MVQEIIFLDDKQDKIVEKYSKLWNISKTKAILKIIREFGKMGDYKLMVYLQNQEVLKIVDNIDKTILQVEN